MARAKKTNQWAGDQRDPSLGNMFGAMAAAASKELGRNDVSIGREAENQVGLPFPALALRYLFQSTTYPLSRILQITGQEGSAKSAFLYEIMRWHFVYGGGAILAENENKDSPVLRHSILQWNPQWMNRMVVQPTYVLEEWQDVFTTYIQIARDQQDAPGGPGRTVPIVMAVDSIMSTAPRSEIEKMIKEGHAAIGFALAAQLISRYMRFMPERLQNYPFSVVGTNHLKPGTDARGFPTSTSPGGKSVKFMETFEIEMAHTADKDIDRLDYGGLRVRMIARKNGFGPSRKQIQAELLWWHAPDHEGMMRQQTGWDWDSASIELLVSFEIANGKKTIFNKLQEICDIRVVRKGSKEAYSKTLGLGTKENPVHYRELGAALENRPDLLTPIYHVLGVAQTKVFQPGVDYRVTLEAARAEAAARNATLYKDVTDMPLIDLGAAPELDPEAPERPEDVDDGESPVGGEAEA